MMAANYVGSSDKTDSFTVSSTISLLISYVNNHLELYLKGNKMPLYFNTLVYSFFNKIQGGDWPDLWKVTSAITDIFKNTIFLCSY